MSLWKRNSGFNFSNRLFTLNFKRDTARRHNMSYRQVKSQDVVITGTWIVSIFLASLRIVKSRIICSWRFHFKTRRIIWSGRFQLSTSWFVLACRPHLAFIVQPRFNLTFRVYFFPQTLQQFLQVTCQHIKSTYSGHKFILEFLQPIHPARRIQLNCHLQGLQMALLGFNKPLGHSSTKCIEHFRPSRSARRSMNSWSSFTLALTQSIISGMRVMLTPLFLSALKLLQPNWLTKLFTRNIFCTFFSGL